jgi:hypothetical protein
MVYVRQPPNVSTPSMTTAVASRTQTGEGLMSGGLAGGDPDLGGSPGPIAPLLAVQASGVDEGRERAVDLAGFLVAAEQVADFGAADPILALLGQRPDLVGGGVAEYPAGAVVGVAPDLECGFEVWQVDRRGTVEQRVDQRQADRLW